MAYIAKVSTGEKPVIIDNSTPNVSYCGYPAAGAQEAEPGWAIKKIAVNAGITTVTWAGGNREKKHKWSERSTLNYSRE